jgi:hypothetical protein
VALMALVCLSLNAADPKETFPISLHATRAGKAHWYGAANGGFEKWTGIGIERLGCKDCHGATNADGEPYPMPYPGPSCVDCHASADNAVRQNQCLGCHGRQSAEALRMKLPDVHRDAGMVCWDCHTGDDLHGDGTTYPSLLAAGAIKADCSDCHPDDALPEEHVEHDPHEGAVHCTSCHSKTVISCYNCHLESQAEGGVKRAMQEISDFVMLVNRSKDGAVHPASFQSLTHGGNAFVAFGPYTPHATTRQGRSCGECHVNQGEAGNAAISHYNSTGEIRFVSWNADKRTLEWMRGVVPIPEDYRTTLKMEFMTFNGDPASKPGPNAGAWSPIGKDTWDGSQMFFATPLTREQMTALGFERRGAE